MGRDVYQTHMLKDVYTVVTDSRKHTRDLANMTQMRPLKLFPACVLLVSIALDFLSPLLKATNGNEVVMIMTDQSSSPTRAVAPRKQVRGTSCPFANTIGSYHSGYPSTY